MLQHVLFLSVTTKELLISRGLKNPWTFHKIEAHLEFATNNRNISLNKGTVGLARMFQPMMATDSKHGNNISFLQCSSNAGIEKENTDDNCVSTWT